MTERRAQNLQDWFCELREFDWQIDVEQNIDKFINNGTLTCSLTSSEPPVSFPSVFKFSVASGPSTDCGKVNIVSVMEWIKYRIISLFWPKLLNKIVFVKIQKIEAAYLSDGESSGLPLDLFIVWIISPTLIGSRHKNNIGVNFMEPRGHFPRKHWNFGVNKSWTNLKTLILNSASIGLMKNRRCGIINLITCVLDSLEDSVLSSGSDNSLSLL